MKHTHTFSPFLTGSSVSEYRVGSEYGWSALYKFTAMTPRSDGGYEIAVFGDLGNQNARSLAKLQRLAQDGDIDMVLHVGGSFGRIIIASKTTS